MGSTTNPNPGGMDTTAQTQTPASDVLPTITGDDFAKADLRFGTVNSAERVPNTDKLVKMNVSFGTFERQIVAGIGLTFTDPTTLVGKQFLFVVNLPPRSLKGVESNGMLLAAGEPTSLSLVSPSGTISPGSRVR